MVHPQRPRQHVPLPFESIPIKSLCPCLALSVDHILHLSQTLPFVIEITGALLMLWGLLLLFLAFCIPLPQRSRWYWNQKMKDGSEMNRKEQNKLDKKK